jgi:hypothetical protein
MAALTGKFAAPGANPAKVEDFGDEDLLQILSLARDRTENHRPLFLITRLMA